MSGRPIGARLSAVLLAVAAVRPGLHAQTSVTSDRLVNAAREPQNWLTYSGSLMSRQADFGQSPYSMCARRLPGDREKASSNSWLPVAVLRK